MHILHILISGNTDWSTDHDNNEEPNNIEKTDKPQFPHDISSSNYLLILIQFLERSLKFSVFAEAHESQQSLEFINLKILSKTDLTSQLFFEIKRKL